MLKTTSRSNRQHLLPFQPHKIRTRPVVHRIQCNGSLLCGWHAMMLADEETDHHRVVCRANRCNPGTGPCTSCRPYNDDIRSGAHDLQHFLIPSAVVICRDMQEIRVHTYTDRFLFDQSRKEGCLLRPKSYRNPHWFPPWWYSERIMMPLGASGFIARCLLRPLLLSSFSS